jgi:hypothetical protein
VNIIMSQLRDGSVVPNIVPATSKRGTSSMPTDLSWRCMISNVRARSWLPVVVEKRNDSLPTPGHDQMLLLLADGVLGPPVHPCPFSLAMTPRCENWYTAQFGR